MPAYVCVQTQYACYDYRLTLPDGDIIDYSVGPGTNPAGYEFQLTKAPAITWWKGLKGFKNATQYVGELGIKDSNNTSGILSFTKTNNDAHIIFTKAKFLGIVTEMYRLNRLQDKMSNGQRCTFHWASE